MKIVALLSWYDEAPDWLTECVTRCGGLVDHVIAVDGPYADFPGAAQHPSSRQDQVEAILRAGVPVTVHLSRAPWPTEVAKRDFMFRLAAPLDADWLFRIDADEFVTDIPSDVRDRLTGTSRDVAEVYLDESPPGVPGPLRALFRAHPGIRVTHAHSLVTVPTEGRCLVLAGDPGTYPLDPAEPLHDIRLEHRRHLRPRVRQDQKAAYYRLMPQIETTSGCSEKGIRMKVRTKVAISGTINGQPWPERGGVIDLPDVVAVKMLASGQATHVAEDDDVETTVDERPVETREATEATESTDSAVDVTPDDEDIDVLRAEAAELGLKVHHNAKAETIRRQIDEALLAEDAE